MRFGSQIDSQNQHKVYQRLLSVAKSRPKADKGIKVGDHVRCQLPRTISAYGPRYSVSCSGTLVQVASSTQRTGSGGSISVTRVDDSKKPWLFELTDLAGEPLNKLWYAKQLLVIGRHGDDDQQSD